MLEDDIVTTTKWTVANTSYSQYDRSKGKRGRDDQNRRGKHDSSYLRCIGRHNEIDRSSDRAAMQQTRENTS